MTARTDLRCPVCGQTVKWGCQPQPGGVGWAHCEDGGRVTLRVSPHLPVCEWRGGEVVRADDGSVGWAPGHPLVEVPAELLSAARDALRVVEAAGRLAKDRGPERLRIEYESPNGLVRRVGDLVVSDVADRLRSALGGAR